MTVPDSQWYAVEWVAVKNEALPLTLCLTQYSDLGFKTTNQPITNDKS